MEGNAIKEGNGVLLKKLTSEYIIVQSLTPKFNYKTLMCQNNTKSY